MEKWKQLSIFDREIPQPEQLQPLPTDLPREYANTEALPPRSLTRKQRKLEEEQFEELSKWLYGSLQPFLTKPLIVKRAYGKTRYIAMKQEGQEIVLRIHTRFIDAPESVREAVVGWLKGPRRKPPKLVQQYIHEFSTLAATEQRLQSPRDDLNTQGKFFDLGVLYRQVNDQYFSGSCRVAIGW